MSIKFSMMELFNDVKYGLEILQEVREGQYGEIIDIEIENEMTGTITTLENQEKQAIVKILARIILPVMKMSKNTE